jgi:O-antigen ligase
MPMKKILIFLEYSLLSVLSFLLFISPFSRWYAKTLIISAFLLWLIWKAVSKDLSFRLPRTLLLPVLAIFVVCAFGLFLSRDFHHSQKIVFNRYFPYLMAFILGIDLAGRSKRNFYWFACAFLFSAAFVAAGGIWDYLVLQPIRLYSSFGRKIPFAMLPLFITYFFPFCAAVVCFAKNRILSILAAVALVFLFPCVIWQGSRAAWVAIALSALLVALLRSRRVFFSVVIFLSLILSFGILSPGIRHKLETLPHPSQWNYRTPLYASALKMFSDHPVIGTGLGMYEQLIKKPEYALPADYPNPDKSLYLHPHSVYFEVMAETGVIGLLAFFYFFVAYFYFVLSSLKRFTDPDTKAFVVGISALVFAALIFGISGSIITVGVNETIIFWFLTGISIGLIHGEKQTGVTENG